MAKNNVVDFPSGVPSEHLPDPSPSTFYRKTRIEKAGDWFHDHRRRIGRTVLGITLFATGIAMAYVGRDTYHQSEEAIQAISQAKSNAVDRFNLAALDFAVHGFAYDQFATDQKLRCIFTHQQMDAMLNTSPTNLDFRGDRVVESLADKFNQTAKPGSIDESNPDSWQVICKIPQGASSDVIAQNGMLALGTTQAAFSFAEASVNLAQQQAAPNIMASNDRHNAEFDILDIALVATGALIVLNAWRRNDYVARSNPPAAA